MNFIKKIFDGKIDSSVHLQFQKFSRGEFKNRAVIEAKKSGKNYTIKTSSEFANEFVKIVATKLGENKTLIKGAVISTQDLKEELKFKEIKQFQGVKRYLIESEISGFEILNLIEKFPKNFFALTFETEGCSLKIKPKAPKSGKPGKGDEAPKADFCVLKTNDEEIGKSFVFECDDFKEAKINHTFVIESIEIPSELKDSKDFKMVREESKRKGKILRKIVIDGKEMQKEKNFEA